MNNINYFLTNLHKKGLIDTISIYQIVFCFILI